MSLDISLTMARYGIAHIITESLDKIKYILSNLGFKFMHAPEMDDDYYNFTSLNISEYHPARSMHDTFYLENGKLLRTHTSNIQARIKSFPCRIASIGKVYRSDNDATHIPMFHQVECFVVEENVNLQHMKYTIEYLLNNFFDRAIDIRLRSSYFPFTIPSFEIDILMNGKWLEILGCGMIHRNIINKNGFALGLGVERLVMIKENIDDIRLFYSNDQRWLGGNI